MADRAEEVETAWAALEQEAKAENAPMAMVELDSMAALRKTNDQAQARRAMFKAAVAVVHRGGGERLDQFRDPFGTRPFTYRALSEGFQLQSELRNELQGGPKEKKNHITLTVGPITEK